MRVSWPALIMASWSCTDTDPGDSTSGYYDEMNGWTCKELWNTAVAIKLKFHDMKHISHAIADIICNGPLKEQEEIDYEAEQLAFDRTGTWSPTPAPTEDSGDVPKLKDACFRAAEVKDAGDSAYQLKDGGLSAAELKESAPGAPRGLVALGSVPGCVLSPAQLLRFSRWVE